MVQRPSLGCVAVLALVVVAASACSRNADSGGEHAATSAAPTKSAVAPVASASAAAAAASSSSPTPPAPSVVALDEKGPLRGFVANAPFSFPHGGATLTDTGLELDLTSEPFDCAKPPKGGAHLKIDVPVAPSGKVDTGRPLGVEVEVVSPDSDRTMNVSAALAHVTLAALPSAKDGRVRGSLVADNGAGTKMMSSGKRTTLRSAVGGTFDVALCPDRRSAKPRSFGKPPAVGAAVAGRVGGEPFAAKSALAIVFRDRGTGVDYVSALDFFGAAGVTCDSRTSQAGPVLGVRQPGGARGDAPLLAGAQPAAPEITTRKGGSVSSTSSSSQRAWVTFESMDLSAKGTVRGSAVLATLEGADRGDEVSAAGRFTATVCHLGDFPP